MRWPFPLTIWRISAFIAINHCLNKQLYKRDLLYVRLAPAEAQIAIMGRGYIWNKGIPKLPEFWVNVGEISTSRDRLTAALETKN